MGTTLRKLKTTYGAHRERVAYSRLGDDLYKELFFAKPPYSELADLEMISQILQSPHRHIVLFAGGLHCHNIVDFLFSAASFEVIHSVVDRDWVEIDPHELKRIAHSHGRETRTPQRPYRAPNPGPSTRPVRPGKTAKPAPLKTKKKPPTEIAEKQKKQLLVGGAVALGALMLSAYRESKDTGVAMSGIAQRKLLNTLKYGAIPGLLYYALIKNQKYQSALTA